MTNGDPRSNPELVMVPPGVWARLTTFLRAGHDGQVVFHVSQGRIVKLQITSYEATKDLDNRSPHT